MIRHSDTTGLSGVIMGWRMIVILFMPSDVGELQVAIIGVCGWSELPASGFCPLRVNSLDLIQKLLSLGITARKVMLMVLLLVTIPVR